MTAHGMGVSIFGIMAFALGTHASRATAGPVDFVEFDHAAIDHYCRCVSS